MARRYYFTIGNIAPLDVRVAPEATRLAFFEIVKDVALQRKQFELSLGWNARGEKMPGVLPKTQEYRKSAMSSAPPWRLTGPYLMPASRLSRTRSLLTGQAYPTHVRITWLVDPISGDPWTKVLSYHADRPGGVYNVIGISPRGKIWIQNEAIKRWRSKSPPPPPRIYTPPPIDWTPPATRAPAPRPWAARP